VSRKANKTTWQFTGTFVPIWGLTCPRCFRHAIGFLAGDKTLRQCFARGCNFTWREDDPTTEVYLRQELPHLFRETPLPTLRHH
jgi:hypothetical protein